MRFGRRRGDEPRGEDFRAVEEATAIAERAPELLGRAAGVEWYEQPGTDVDYAAYMLCRLRRARAGALGGPGHGDEAVRVALLRTEQEALVWFASRAVSYMDENGFPEAVEPWFGDGREATDVEEDGV
jgi:hypothetical protein